MKNDLLPAVRKRGQTEREGRKNEGDSHGVSTPLEGVRLHCGGTLSPTKRGRFENRTIAGSPDSNQLQGVSFEYKRNRYPAGIPPGRRTKRIYYTRELPIHGASFFIGKKDSDELQPVMDYREINKWMKRDHNPLPNIRTALENLREGELYLKFDIRWGYKNLRIRKEDQHKAAFKTMFGTYIPKVTYFGLTNAPPTFQRIIHQDLRPILQKYPRAFGNYLDDTWIVTRKTPEGRALHRRITHELFDLLESKSYFLKLGKCQFKQESIDLLGWTVGNGEI